VNSALSAAAAAAPTAFGSPRTQQAAPSDPYAFLSSGNGFGGVRSDSRGLADDEARIAEQKNAARALRFAASGSGSGSGSTAALLPKPQAFQAAAGTAQKVVAAGAEEEPQPLSREGEADAEGKVRRLNDAGEEEDE
jgi:hypothetical protein